MPQWSSILKIFFACDESSLLERFSVATSAYLFEHSPIAALCFPPVACCSLVDRR